jgi:serine-type D-Ala-D-Ala carboxypeptidase/endopeptidase (penicillin-binding protein 4)
VNTNENPGDQPAPPRNLSKEAFRQALIAIYINSAYRLILMKQLTPHFHSIFISSILMILFASPVYPGQNSSREKAEKEILSILERPSISGNIWSILIKNQPGTHIWYSKNPEDFLKPASNIKLFTTACAYNKLGWDHRWNGQRIYNAIKSINKKSINSRANSLLRHIGKELSQDESMLAGAENVIMWSESIGIDMSGAKIVDGSGRSHNNLLSAQQIISLLHYMTRHHDKWDDSLAIGGVDGTIAHRLNSMPEDTMVYAKTGTLSGVISLSGMIEYKEDPVILFSFLANNVNNKTATRKAIDDCVKVIVKSAYGKNSR